MRIIAIDPGRSTGLVVYDGPEIVMTLEIDEAELYFIDQLINLLRIPIVCERSPERGHQPKATKQVEQLVEAYDDVLPIYWVRPSEWKGTPHSTLTDAQEKEIVGKGRHIRDAALIGRWYLRTQRRFDAPV